MTTRLSDLDVVRVDIVDRAAVRDPQNQSQPARFLAWKSEAGAPSSNKERSTMKNETSKRLAEALSKAAENESALDTFLSKDEVTPEMAGAIKGAYRLLSAHKAALTPEVLAEMAKAMGVELIKGDAPAFGNDKDGKPFAEGHAFQPKESADGTCDKCGLGGGHAVHMVASNGASGSRTVEAAEKAEEEGEPTEDTIKAELAKADISPAVRSMLEKSLETAKADRERADAAEVEKAEAKEQIAKSEVRDIVKGEMSHVPGLNEDALTELLHGVRKSDSKTFDTLRPILKSASEAIKAGAAIKTAGVGGQDGLSDDPNARATEIAKGIQKAEDVTAAKAKALAWERNPELRKQYEAERVARAAQQ